MSAKVEISRTDRTAGDLKAMAKKSKCKDHRRRLRAIARVLAGEESRSEVAKRAGVDLQTLRDWVRRYNEEGADGLKNRPRSGRRARLDADQAEAVREWLETGPDPGAGEPARRAVADIRRRIENLFEIKYSVEGVRLPVRRLGFRNVSPRPIHPKADPRAQEEFRSNFKALAREALPGGVSPESAGVWFQDEARIGQKGMLSRVWARKGTRPRIPRDHRYGYCYLFSAACPSTGQAVGHVCERANTDEMNRHLKDVGAAVPEGGHAIIVLDGAGWHRSKALEVPGNVSLLRLPPYSPEPDPMETVFSLLKHKHFANRVFQTAEHVRDAVAEVWSNFAEQANAVKKITDRDWAVP